MSIEEFCEQLANTTAKYGLTWTLDRFGRIRSATWLVTPPSIVQVVALAKRRTGTILDAAPPLILLDPLNALVIMSAADNDPKHSAKVRAAILKSCGLSPI